MIIVAGHLRVVTSDRDTVFARSLEAVKLARNAPGCRDSAVSADPSEQRSTTPSATAGSAA